MSGYILFSSAASWNGVSRVRLLLLFSFSFFSSLRKIIITDQSIQYKKWFRCLLLINNNNVLQESNWKTKIYKRDKSRIFLLYGRVICTVLARDLVHILRLFTLCMVYWETFNYLLIYSYPSLPYTRSSLIFSCFFILFPLLNPSLLSSLIFFSCLFILFINSPFFMRTFS